MSDQPLAGIHVVDLTWNLPGPYTTAMLASMGARVTKVEPPRGDPARTIRPMFDWLNAGKEGVTLDLRTDEDRGALRALVEGADVLVEGFRPGVAARLGCDADTARSWNPSLIYCSISAFGQDGPRHHQPAHDLNLQALTGLCHLARDASGRPHPLPLPVADLSAAMSAVASICAALYEREVSGGGAALDIAMADGPLSWAWLWGEGIDLASQARRAVPSGLRGLFDRVVGEPLDRKGLHAMPHYDLYRCRDGRWIAVGIVDEDKFWRSLCEVLGLPDRVARLPLPARTALGPALRRWLQRKLARRDRAAWLAALEEADVPVTAVLTPAEARAEPHLARRSVVEGRVRMPLAGARVGTGEAPELAPTSA
jgi:crotonobetainyl-CoA:carnitine CoA-transferase CaiB-like acyl-CoA transferase